MKAKWLSGIVKVSLLISLCAGSMWAQGTPSGEAEDLRREIETLKEGQQAIQRELREIKSLLRVKQAPAPAAPREIVLNIGGKPFKGERSAKLTVIEFSDYQ